MKTQLIYLSGKILTQMRMKDVAPVVEITDNLSYGDYTTNVAMIIAKRF